MNQLDSSNEEVIEEWIQIGKLGSTHGIKGEIKLFSVSDVPDRFNKLNEVWWKGLAGEIKHLKVSECRPCERFFLIKFEGFDNPEEASGLSNGIIQIPLAQRGILPKNQYFLDEIIGLQVEDENGKIIGSVSEIYQTGSNDVYAIQTNNGELLLPAIEEIIRGVCIKEQKMIVHIPEGY